MLFPTFFKSTVRPEETGRTPLSFRLFVFGLFTALALFLQWEEGAYRSEFGGHPDEAAHYVTGLLVRDTLVFAKNFTLAGFHGSPVKVGKDFVQSYYDHYPKIGLGVWPPLFYLAQSAWTLPFGASRESVLALMAVLSALTATVLFFSVRQELGTAPAAFAGLVWLGLPLVQQYSGMIMAEMFSALLMFGAALRFGRYLDERRPTDAYVFGFLAAAAILTKGTGLALAFTALFAILLTGSLAIFKERALWIAGGIVALLAGPWTWATRKLGEGGWEQAHPSLGFTLKALPYYGMKTLVAVGVLLAAFIVLGIALKIGRRGNSQGKWASAFALIVSVLLFQSIAPVGREARHLIPILPALVMFAAAGLAATAGWLRRATGGFSTLDWTVCGSTLLVWIAVPAIAGGVPSPYGSIGDAVRFSPFRITQKPAGGFGPVTAELLRRSDKNKRGGVFLVSSDASGEGMFIAETAMREERRPDHLAKRASKELAVSSWSGGGYKAKFESDGALLAWLTGGAVDYVVLDTAIPERNRRPHHDMLRKVIETHAETFEQVASHPLMRNADDPKGEVRAYRIRRS